MIGNIARYKAVAEAAQNPRESEKAQAVTRVLADVEHRQLDALADLEDALGVDVVDVQEDREERQKKLLDVIEAVASNDLKGWWFNEVAAEHLENADDAKHYAGIDSEEWQAQIGRWAEMYREKGHGEDMTDRELAAYHVRTRFGVDLGTWEREVINWSPMSSVEAVLGGNLLAVESALGELTKAVENGAVEIEEVDEDE